MPTYDGVADYLRKTVAEVDQAIGDLAAAGDALRAVVTQLAGVGLQGSAASTEATRRDVEVFAATVAQARSRGVELAEQVLALKEGRAPGGSAGGGVRSDRPRPAGPPGSTVVRERPALLRPGLDPGEHRGALGDGFRAGVHDPHGRLLEKERRIADRVAAGGDVAVHPRARNDKVSGLKNPDAMVRVGADDAGTITEFKTLTRGSNAAVKRDILRAGKQVSQHGGGDAVIDGEDVGLTASEARRGYGRAVGTGGSMPERVRIILADGSILKFPES